MVATADFNVCLYDETDKRVRLDGRFRSEALAGSSQGTVKWTDTRAKARFTFTGSSVAFVSSYGPDRGIAAMKLDGVKVGRVNLYGPNVRAGRVVWATSVVSGRHELVVIIRGKHKGASTGSRVDIDGFISTGLGEPN